MKFICLIPSEVRNSLKLRAKVKIGKEEIEFVMISASGRIL